MPFTGKNGSDAIAFAFKHICKVILRYNTKLRAAISQAVTDGVITSLQAEIATTFLDGATVTCEIFILVAGNSGFNS